MVGVSVGTASGRILMVVGRWVGFCDGTNVTNDGTGVGLDVRTAPTSARFKIETLPTVKRAWSRNHRLDDKSCVPLEDKDMLYPKRSRVLVPYNALL